jgi:hypothetical protein
MTPEEIAKRYCLDRKLWESYTHTPSRNVCEDEIVGLLRDYGDRRAAEEREAAAEMLDHMANQCDRVAAEHKSDPVGTAHQISARGYRSAAAAIRAHGTPPAARATIDQPSSSP